MVSTSAWAATWQGGLLYSRFGVTLDCYSHVFASGSVYRFQNQTGNSMNWSPTASPHPDAVFSYIVNDFCGYPSNGNMTASEPGSTNRAYYVGPDGNGDVNDVTEGTWPSGGEVYDTEAIYMTNDEHNIYIAIITSMPPPPGVAVPPPNIMIATGDLAIHTPDGDYWYGVDINRADNGPDSLGSLPTGEGNELYKTQGNRWQNQPNNDPTGGWYTTNWSHKTSAVNSPDTNFRASDFTGNKMGDVIVDYLNLSSNGSTGYFKEGYESTISDYAKYSTWEVNITIPISLLPDYAALKRGESRTIGFTFVAGCRNDGNSAHHILRLDGDYHDVPEPGTFVLTALGLLGLGLLRRRRGVAK